MAEYLGRNLARRFRGRVEERRYRRWPADLGDLEIEKLAIKGPWARGYPSPRGPGGTMGVVV